MSSYRSPDLPPPDARNLTRQILSENLRSSLEDEDVPPSALDPLLSRIDAAAVPFSPTTRFPSAPAYKPAYTPPEETTSSSRLSKSRTPEIGAGDSAKDDESPAGNPSGSSEDDGSPKAPDGGYGWVIVVAVFFIHVILDGTTFSFPVLLPPLTEHFMVDKMYVSTVVSCLMGATFFCAPFASVLNTKFGIRKVAVVGAIISFIGAFLSVLSKQYWHMTLTYGVIMGIGFGGIYLPAIVNVATWFDKRRATAMGIAVCGSGIGIFGFSKILVHLIEVYGVPSTLLIESAVIFNVTIAAALLRPLEHPRDRRKREKLKRERDSEMEMQRLKEKPHEPASPVAEAAASGNVIVRGFKTFVGLAIWRMWQYWVMLVVVFTCGISGYVPFTYLSDYAMEKGGIDESQSSTLVAVTGGFNLAGRLASGILSDQKWCNRYLLYSSAYILNGINTIFSVLCTDFTSFCIFGSIYGFTAGVIIALQSVILTDIVGIENLNAAFGISLFVLGIAALVGPPTAGAVVRNHGYHVAMGIFGLIISIGGAFFLVVPLYSACRRLVKRFRSGGASQRTSMNVSA